MVSQLSLNLFSAVAREGNSNCPPKWTEEHHRQFRILQMESSTYKLLMWVRYVELGANLRVELAKAQGH